MQATCTAIIGTTLSNLGANDRYRADTPSSRMIFTQQSTIPEYTGVAPGAVTYTEQYTPSRDVTIAITRVSKPAVGNQPE